MKQQTINNAIALYSNLTYDEGDVAFTDGTPEYALMDALIQNDEISNAIDARLGITAGTTKRMWNFDFLKVTQESEE